MLFHIHRFGPVKDGYQYCIKCQKAFPVEHKCLWEEVETRTVTTEDLRHPDSEKRVTAEIKILKCHVCGDLKEFRISV
jgi:hypothetical protein